MDEISTSCWFVPGPWRPSLVHPVVASLLVLVYIVLTQAMFACTVVVCGLFALDPAGWVRGQDVLAAWFLWAALVTATVGLILTVCSSWMLRAAGLSGCICAARKTARWAGLWSLRLLLGAVVIAVVAAWATADPIPVSAAVCGGLLSFAPVAVMLRWQLRLLLRTGLTRWAHPAGPPTHMIAGPRAVVPWCPHPPPQQS
jgi:hypothetical protein